MCAECVPSMARAVVKAGRAWRCLIVVVLVVVNWGGELVVACPARCQCDLVHVPRTVSCAGQGLQTFPENISDVVSIHVDRKVGGTLSSFEWSGKYFEHLDIKVGIMRGVEMRSIGVENDRIGIRKSLVREKLSFKLD